MSKTEKKSIEWPVLVHSRLFGFPNNKVMPKLKHLLQTSYNTQNHVTLLK